MKSLEKAEISLRKNRELVTAPKAESLFQFGPFLLNAAERVLLCEGERVPLTPKVFETLLTLVENAGHIVQKETLIKRVWPDTIVQEDNLTFNISALRKALGEHHGGQQFIQTEHKVGYRFVAPVKILPPGSAEAAVTPIPRPVGNSKSLDAATATGNSREVVLDERLKLRRWAKWGAVGLALLVVAAGTVWLATPPPQPKVVKYDQITADGRAKREGLATDGERLYFIEQASTGWVIAQVPASGGEPVPIASTPIDSHITDITPDHRDLLVVEGRQFAPGTLKLVPVLGGEPRRLGNIRAYSASWSPDGPSLAYTTDSGLYLCDPDGSNSRRIVTMSGQLIHVRWSPSGSKLCFTRSEHSESSLWEVDRDGTGLVCLIPEVLSGIPDSHGLWTPNGKYFIADSICAGHFMPSASRLSLGPFVPHWGQPACLGSGPLDLAVSAISPDGARLFGLENGVGRRQMEYYDTHSQQFKPFLPSVSAGYADFSRDGQRIAYVTGWEELTGASSLWISQIDGSHKVQITKPPLRTQLPRWSPDGKWIAFMGKNPGQPWRVRVVSVDGGSYAPATAVSNEEGAPTWSPDSSQIAFGGMTQPPERTTGQLVIHILNLKTGQLSKVAGSEGLWTARWSPDGRYIAALTGDSRDLMLFDFRSSRWAKLTTMAKIPDLVWSRHEEAIYFNGEPTTGDRALFRVKLPGGQLERLASLSGRSESDWIGLTPDDSPLIARNSATSEIYALTVNWP